MNASTAADTAAAGASGQPGRTRLRDWIGAVGAYLWSGWGPASGILVFAAIWELTAQAVGPLILPTPPLVETPPIVQAAMASSS